MLLRDKNQMWIEPDLKAGKSEPKAGSHQQISVCLDHYWEEFSKQEESVEGWPGSEMAEELSKA